MADDPKLAAILHQLADLVQWREETAQLAFHVAIDEACGQTAAAPDPAPAVETPAVDPAPVAPEAPAEGPVAPSDQPQPTAQDGTT